MLKMKRDYKKINKEINERIKKFNKLEDAEM
jgi:hypothetical protein